jgi:hypothetical protein
MAHLLLDRRPATRDVIDRLPLEEGAEILVRGGRVPHAELDGLIDAAGLRRKGLSPAALAAHPGKLGV